MRIRKSFVTLVLGLGLSIAIGLVQAQNGGALLTVKDCHTNCRNIAEQDAGVLMNLQKIEAGKTYYCHRYDPSEGIQHVSRDSAAAAESMKLGGYTCYLPTVETYFKNCIQSCLQKVPKN